MRKSELRKIYADKRRSLSGADLEWLSEKAAATLFAEVEFANLSAVHCFITIEKFAEIDTRFIFERIWSDYPDVRTAVPRLKDREGGLEHVYYTRDTRMARNTWEISEPVGGPAADPTEFDLVIVPLLCFDESGYRVGYGGGYYDRFLRECRSDCVTVGLSFFPPVKEIDDIHVGDVALDMFVMPEGVFKPDR